jgi:hypothetical protein
MAWVYEKASNRYKSTDTGRYLSQEAAKGLRDRWAVAQREKATGLASRLASGDLTLKGWEQQARALTKETHLAQALLGRGGRNMMTAADWGRVGNTLRAQYGFLREFANEIAGGTLTEAQIAGRLGMYTDASRQSYEKARAASWGITLPAHPGDGNTRCLTRCACWWDLQKGPDGVTATWRLGASDHCEDCLENAAQWSPYSGGARVRIAGLSLPPLGWVMSGNGAHG